MLTKTDIEKYFIAEKNATLILLILGIAFLIIAIIFFFVMKHPWYKGLAIPIAIIALLQIAVGYNVYSKSDKDRQQLVYAFDMNPEKIIKEELPRMEQVMKTFTWIKFFEVAMALVGVLLIILLKDKPRLAIYSGIGFGLLLQAFVSFSFDAVAEKRAHIYLEKLQQFADK